MYVCISNIHIIYLYIYACNTCNIYNISNKSAYLIYIYMRVYIYAYIYEYSNIYIDIQAWNPR